MLKSKSLARRWAYQSTAQPSARASTVRKVSMFAHTNMKLLRDEKMRKKLAKMIALHCVRNTVLEDLHSGVTPSSKSGDYSDVKVVTPYGEIPWVGAFGGDQEDGTKGKVSRLSDEEMKELMIEVVDKIYLTLSNLDVPTFTKRLEKAFASEYDPCPQWNEPKIPEGTPKAPTNL